MILPYNSHLQRRVEGRKNREKETILDYNGALCGFFPLNKKLKIENLFHNLLVSSVQMARNN